jgi:hypothetical protein
MGVRDMMTLLSSSLAGVMMVTPVSVIYDMTAIPLTRRVSIICSFASQAATPRGGASNGTAWRTKSGRMSMPQFSLKERARLKATPAHPRRSHQVTQPQAADSCCWRLRLRVSPQTRTA